MQRVCARVCVPAACFEQHKWIVLSLSHTDVNTSIVYACVFLSTTVRLPAFGVVESIVVQEFESAPAGTTGTARLDVAYCSVSGGGRC